MGLFDSLFGSSKPKHESKLKRIIEEDGLTATINMLTDLTNQKISSKNVALQFVLEELDASSQGNETSIAFARHSGFSEDEYEDAMMNATAEVDGPDGPQEFLTILMELNDRELMAKMRIAIVDNIMQIWKLGKYSNAIKQSSNKRLIDLVDKNAKLDVGIFGNIQNDLAEYISIAGQNEDKLRMMAYGYARRSSAAGLFLQGIFGKKEYAHASDMFKKLQLMTGHTKEFQIKATNQSNELIASYDKRLTPDMISSITSLVELDQVVCIYDQGKTKTVDEVLKILSPKEKTHSQNISNQERIIEEDGLPATISMLTELTNRKITSKKIAFQFILEELDAASQGNEISISFAKNSGFAEHEYEDAMMNSIEEVSGTDSPQEFLTILLELDDRELMSQIRVAIVDNIMKIWKIGKYQESIINHENIIATANTIANDCFPEGDGNPKWKEVYNVAFASMYASAYYLGYSVSDGLRNISLYSREAITIDGILEILNDDEDTIREVLLSRLENKKFSAWEKEIVTNNPSIRDLAQLCYG